MKPAHYAFSDEVLCRGDDDDGRYHGRRCVAHTLRRLSHTRRPSLTAATMVAKLSSARTILAASFDTSVPAHTMEAKGNHPEHYIITSNLYYLCSSVGCHPWQDHQTTTNLSNQN